MGIKTHHTTDTKPVILRTQMCFNGSQQQDPIQTAEQNDMTTYNPYINHNGGILYINGEFSIVHKDLESDEAMQRRKNIEDGKGPYTDAELMLLQDSCFSIYDNSSDWLAAPSKYDEKTYEQYNTHYDDYIDMVKSGEIIDDGASCRMGNPAMGDSISGDQVNDDLIDDAQAYNINYAVDTQGNETKRSANDAKFQKALTDVDNQAIKLPYQLDMVDRIAAEVTGASNFKSTASSGIQTDVKPTESFAAAASPEAKPKSVVFKKDSEPLPWANKPTADVPANSPQFVLSA